jgi:hypothetical protein
MQVSKGKYCKEAQIPWYLLVRVMPFDESVKSLRTLFRE